MFSIVFSMFYSDFLEMYFRNELIFSLVDNKMNVKLYKTKVLFTLSLIQKFPI